jgi:hypothetical protein
MESFPICEECGEPVVKVHRARVTRPCTNLGFVVLPELPRHEDSSRVFEAKVDGLLRRMDFGGSAPKR